MESSVNGGFSHLQSCGDSSEEELSVLPRHTKVVVTGNNRTKSVLVGLQGVVKKAVGLGGWHWLVIFILFLYPSKRHCGLSISSFQFLVANVVYFHFLLWFFKPMCFCVGQFFYFLFHYYYYFLTCLFLIKFNCSEAPACCRCLIFWTILNLSAWIVIRIIHSHILIWNFKCGFLRGVGWIDFFVCMFRGNNSELLIVGIHCMSFFIAGSGVSWPALCGSVVDWVFCLLLFIDGS